jgi:hypothetical protein
MCRKHVSARRSSPARSGAREQGRKPKERTGNREQDNETAAFARARSVHGEERQTEEDGRCEGQQAAQEPDGSHQTGEEVGQHRRHCAMHRQAISRLVLPG